MAFPRNPTQAFKSESDNSRVRTQTSEQSRNRLFSLVSLTLICAALLFTGNAKASAVDNLSKRGQGEMSYLFWTLLS